MAHVARQGWIRSIGCAAVSIIAVFASAGSAGAATLEVNTTLDEFGTGADCSLREAIQAANTDVAFGGCKKGKNSDTIEIRGGKAYIRQQAGSNSVEDQNVSGDYDIASEIRIKVRGKGRAELNGGGLDRVLTIFSTGSLDASKLTVRDGVTYAGPFDGGGGIDNEGTLKLTKSVITQNDALTTGCACGGGLAATNTAKTTLDRVTISDNDSANLGGGLAYLGGKLDVKRSSIAGNSTVYGGGGVYLGGSGESAKIRSSAITGNRATFDSFNAGGGGVFVSDFDDTKLSIANSTIARNDTTSFGGGVWLYSGSLKLNATTITENAADSDASGSGGGGGVAGNVTVTNSIVADNGDPDPANADCLNAQVSSSLTGKNTGCPSGNRTTTKPKLGPLAKNGGPTKTVALKKGSPAIDKAGNGMPSEDQRGRKRDRKPDLGAYER